MNNSSHHNKTAVLALHLYSQATNNLLPLLPAYETVSKPSDDAIKLHELHLQEMSSLNLQQSHH